MAVSTFSKEDYLGTIFRYRAKNKEIKANQIAEKLAVSNAAVTDMLKKLSADGLVLYQPYKGIALTVAGEKQARDIVRRHRIWEMFLFQVVGLSWEKVHEEAHRLEHSSSRELIDRLEEMLGFPRFDPHGDPIPSRSGKIPSISNSLMLSELTENTNAKVVRVIDYSEGFLSYLDEIGLKLNMKIKIMKRRMFDKTIQLQINHRLCDISDETARNIFVEIS